MLSKGLDAVQSAQSNADNLAVQAARVSVEEITQSLLDPLLRTAAAIERDLGVAGSLRRF